MRECLAGPLTVIPDPGDEPPSSGTVPDDDTANDPQPTAIEQAMTVLRSEGPVAAQAG